MAIEQRPDSNTVLRHGTATPYIGIFNPQKSVIRDPKNGLPLGTFVTDFQYVYEEEKTDHGQLTIDTDNPDLVSLNELGYQQGLILQWGYIYPNQDSYIGPQRRVIITGKKAGFTATGVHITLEFTDAASLLKSSPSQHYDCTRGFVEYVKDLCKGIPIGLAIVDCNSTQVLTQRVAHRINKNEDIQRQYPKNHNTGTKAEWATGSKFNAIEPLEMIQPPSVDIPNMVGVELLEWAPNTQKLTFHDPDNFRKVYLREDLYAEAIVQGTSRSKYYQLVDIARGLSGGPYFVDSRDDKIIIHNQQANGDIIKVYTWAGGSGELIEFTINSKFVKTSVEVKQTNELDPDTKSLNTTMVQGIIDPDSGNMDGIDTHMVWPDTGTMFWNPQGGSVRNAPIEAANAPLFGQTAAANKQRNLVEYHQHPNNQVTKVNGTTEKPQRAYFGSVNEAKQWFTAHPQVSQHEIEEWFRSWKQDFEKKRASAIDGVEELAHSLDKIPPFVIEKDITITAEVNLEHLGGSHDLKNQIITENMTETFKNAILSGGDYLSRYEDEYYGRESGLTKNATFMGKVYRENAETMLINGGFQVAEVYRKEGEDEYHFKHRKAENRIVSINTRIRIQLDGIDVAAGADSINILGSLGNDITQQITDSVKAEALVVGDPVLESSMNVQIQNVSEKYSGLWYTKKVTHNINKSGYLTKIEFVQRTVPISQVTIKSTLSKKDYAQQLQEAFKQAKENGSYKNISKLEVEAKQEMDKYISPYFYEAQVPSVIKQVDPRTGRVKTSQMDLESGNYITINNQTYYRGDLSPVIQDLQKQVNQLPE